MVGWFDEFTAWTGQSFPPLEEALENLAKSDLRGRRRARPST